MENNDMLNKIDSENPEAIAEVVKEIKENGDLKMAEALLQHLDHLPTPHLTTIVVNLLADIKDSGFRELLMRQIGNTTLPTVKSELLRIVWESSLDYAPYLETFLDLLQQDDFTVAFEASTVIENMVHHLTEEQRARLTTILDTFPEDKSFLIENIREELAYPED